MEVLLNWHEAGGAETSRTGLQDVIDRSDVIGHWTWDIPEDRLYTDPVVALLFGVDPALAEAGVPLDAFLDGVHWEDREKTAETIARSVEAGHSYVQEYRVHSADGATRWVLARGLVQLDEAGRPARGWGFLIDITRNRPGDDLPAVSRPSEASDPLEQAAEHCLAARHALVELAEPLLRNMTDMLLLEIGRRLSKRDADQRRARLS